MCGSALDVRHPAIPSAHVRRRLKRRHLASVRLTCTYILCMVKAKVYAISSDTRASVKLGDTLGMLIWLETINGILCYFGGNTDT